MAKILIIDDDPHMRRMLERALTGAGYEVIEAKDGGEGLKAFAQHSPTLVVTDIVMPNHEGLETIRELRRCAPLLPVIAISGSDLGAKASLYLDFAGKLGASSMLRKPFRPAALIAEIERLLQIAVSETLIGGDSA
jgi:DNA-binding response OmpR family regulator